MLKQFLSHCENHNLLPDVQSAYHEHYSTEASLIRLSNDILWLMERQQVTAIAILNLSAAFDTVDHEILLQILEQNFGFYGKALHWFQNYLRPWLFRVNINGKYSKQIDLKFSVPQGSCSEANLFTCYCSPIKDSIPSSMTLSGFTDDHSIRKSFITKCHTSKENTNNTIENTLNYNSWLDYVNAAQTQWWQD